MSLLRLVIGFTYLAIVSVITIAVAVLLLPWRVGRIKVCNIYGTVCGRVITAIAGVTPRVSHRERIVASRPAIYVANHTSTLDAFLSIWLCPMGGCGVFKKEIVRVPFFGWLAWLSGHLLIDRGNKERAVEALSDMGRLVKAKRLSLWIMPEGTRSRDGRLLPFKKGFVHFAIATGLPVIPVIFHGAHKNWEWKRFTFHPMPIDIEVLEPIDTAGWTEATAGAHADQVHALFAAALRPDQQPLPKADAAAA